jgi:hypothetical protein
MTFKYFKRAWFDILALASVFTLIFVTPSSILPVEAKAGLLSLFVTKFVLVSAGILHAHIARKLLFPYIDFGNNDDKLWIRHIMIVALYVTIILAWARGG